MSTDLDSVERFSRAEFWTCACSRVNAKLWFACQSCGTPLVRRRAADATPIAECASLARRRPASLASIRPRSPDDESCTPPPTSSEAVPSSMAQTARRVVLDVDSGEEEQKEEQTLVSAQLSVPPSEVIEIAVSRPIVGPQSASTPVISPPMQTHPRVLYAMLAFIIGLLVSIIALLMSLLRSRG